MDLDQLVDHAKQVECGGSVAVPLSRHQESIENAVKAIQRWHATLSEADQVRSYTPEQVAIAARIQLRSVVPALRRIGWVHIGSLRGRWTPPGGEERPLLDKPGDGSMLFCRTCKKLLKREKFRTNSLAPSGKHTQCNPLQQQNVRI